MHIYSLDSDIFNNSRSGLVSVVSPCTGLREVVESAVEEEQIWMARQGQVTTMG